MAYKLTPAQQAGILAADAAAAAAGIPSYYDLVQALAGLTTAVRDDKPTKASLIRACKVLEGLRNETAAPVAVNAKRLQASICG